MREYAGNASSPNPTLSPQTFEAVHRVLNFLQLPYLYVKFEDKLHRLQMDNLDSATRLRNLMVFYSLWNLPFPY